MTIDMHLTLPLGIVEYVRKVNHVKMYMYKDSERRPHKHDIESVLRYCLSEATMTDRNQETPESSHTLYYEKGYNGQIPGPELCFCLEVSMYIGKLRYLIQTN